MSKTYNRVRSGGGEQATALGRSLLSWTGSSDAYVKAITTGIFNHSKVSLSHRIIYKAGRNARLSPYDEKIFDYYKKIIECYEQILFFYNGSGYDRSAANTAMNRYTPHDLRVKNILAGICAVLSSRVRQFDELVKNGRDNPISIEKKEVISKGLGIFIKDYDANTRAYYESNYRNSLFKGRQLLLDDFTLDAAFALFNAIAEEIQAFSAQRLYKAYITSLTFCLKELNSDTRQDTAFFYYELLVKEEELLSGLIKVQVYALEKVIEEGQVNSLEKEFAFIVLTNLREGYRQLKEQVKEIADGWKELKGEEAFEAEGFEQEEDFVIELKEISQGEQIFSTSAFEEHKQKWTRKKVNFTEKLKSELDYLLKKELKAFSLGRTVYELQKIIAEQLFIAKELCRCFEEIIACFESNREALQHSVHWDILLGINETLEIKIESIDENREIFSKEGQRLIEEYKKECCEPDSEVITEVVFSYLRQNQKELFDGNSTEIIEKALEFAMQSPEMLAIRGEAEKIHGNLKTTILTLSGRFKKEQLLYELSTFEEIIIYSVSRLRESEKGEPETIDALAAYVERIDQVSNQIEVNLKKYNINLIKPLPHEMFNAKEHEVLIAEQNSDFKKGEIIKLLNSGYKQEDRVLIRANVIAAK